MANEVKTGTLTLSAGVGNAALDTAYAEYDFVQAAKAVADAKNNLNHMQTLKDNGEASSDAVDDAKTNLEIAMLNLYLAEAKVGAASAKTAASAETFGFYGDVRLEINGSKTNSNSSTVSNVASNVNSLGNITINSGLSLASNNVDLLAGKIGNTIISGSNIASQNGDINIVSKNNTVIEASKDTYNESTTSKSWQESLTLASSAGGGSGTMLDNMINALQISLGLSMSKSKSDTSSVTYNNSTLNATNGDIKITTLATSFDAASSDALKNSAGTKISGANILANNVTINTLGNLTVESLQNSYNSKSKGSSVSLGFGGGASGNVNIAPGVSSSSGKVDRLWTDNQTSVIGSNSVTINTLNNTQITGAIIANITNTASLNNNNGLAGYAINKDTLAGAVDGGNLTLNTNTLTFKNLEDHYYTESSAFGFSTSIGYGGNLNQNQGNGASNTAQGQGTAAANNPNQQRNFYPDGSTTLTLQNSSNKKEGTTFATLGNGNITTNAILNFDANGNLISSTNGNLNDQTILANLNRDISKSQVVTKDQITGALNASVTIDNRILAAAYEVATGAKAKILNDDSLSKEEKKQAIANLSYTQLANEQTNIGQNLQTTTKLQAKLIDAPLSLAATSNIPVVSYLSSYLGGEGGSVATLATQLFGLNYILDSGNTRWQENEIIGLNNKTLATAVKDKYEFALGNRLGQESETNPNQRSNNLYLMDNEDNLLRYSYTTTFKDLRNVTLEDLVNTKDYSLHGIDNTSDEAFRNGIMQLGTLQRQTQNGLSFVTLNAPTKGALPDAFENFYNMLLGKTDLASANIVQLRDFAQTLAAVAPYQNVTTQNSNGQFLTIPSDMTDLRFAGHSNGGDRLDLGILLGGQNKAFSYKDPNDPTKLSSRVQVQFYGTPTNTNNLINDAIAAGLKENKSIHIINQNDYVGEGLGRNRGQNFSSIAPAIYFYNAPKLFTPTSPHSNYYCTGSFCQFDKYK